jgi:hypothetical protein
MSDPAEIQGKASRVYKNAVLAASLSARGRDWCFWRVYPKADYSASTGLLRNQANNHEVRSQCDVRKGQFTG